MDINQLEQEVLFLQKEVRAQLAHKLLLSLDVPSQNEIEEDLLTEASRRSKELDRGTVKPIPAEDVRRKAQALCRSLQQPIIVVVLNTGWGGFKMFEY